jgi:MYXO-CTERM domain-containing protein
MALSRRSLVAASSLAAVFALAPRANAFCRTVTTTAPPDYNAASLGCYAGPPGSKPLYWLTSCVGYSLQQDASKYVTLDQATQAASNAFAVWSAASCPGGGSPSVQAVNNGPVSCGNVQYNKENANQHVIVFRDDAWPHNDSSNTLALTTVTFDLDTGELYDADMEINTYGNKITPNASPSAGEFSLDTIMTHEAGHFLGLAHSTLTSAIMYANYSAASTTLTADDIDGICTIYPSNATRNTAAGSVAEGSCDPAPRHGFNSLCMGPATDLPATTKKACSVSNVGASGEGGAGMLAMLGVLGAALVARRRSARGAKLPRMRSARTAALALFLSASAAGTATFFAGDASASVSIAVLFDELVRDSSAAVVATPVEQHAVWENGRIYTYTRVHVDAKVAGDLPADAWVRTVGGAIGKIGQSVEGEAVLTVGRPALLFLQPQIDRVTNAPLGPYEVTARAQGQFPVVAASGGKSMLIHASGVGALVPTPATRIAHIAEMRAAAGAPNAAAPERADDMLHGRPVDEAARDIVAAWSRLHGR